MSKNDPPLILVVEDEPDIRDLLEMNLKTAGFEVQSAEDGLSGLEKAVSSRPDLVIMDLMMPRMAGDELCRRLRGDFRFRSLPVIMLTAKAGEPDRVAGFEMGADDYVTKPFSLKELIWRVKVLLRRSAAEGTSLLSIDEPSLINCGDLSINRLNHQVRFQGQEIQLTSLEFRLLSCLASKPGRVWTRSTLLELVWGYHEDNSTRTVDTHVRRLRRKLGPAESYLETVHGVGYRFVAG